MLVRRLGLEKARIPHADRHGLVWLERGRLEVEDGCLRFVTAGGGALAPGDYQIPHQANGGLGLATLGEPPKDIVAHYALLLVRRAVPEPETRA
jgi:CRISPR-associated protein Cas1